MAFAHNAMIRGINSIYLQAPHIPPSDASDFLFFISSWCQWIGHHHVLEETQMFPGFEGVIGKKGFLEGNVDQHHAFSGGLKELKRYAESTSSEEYSGAKVVSIIDGFSARLHEHLKEEIGSLLSMKPYDGPRLLKVYKEAEAEAGKQDKNVIPPLALGCCDRNFEGGNNWPEMPWVGPWFVHYLMGRKHAGAWRFLPSDSWRNPRPLKYLGN